MTTRAQIVSEARSWIGTPYAHQGRTKGQAVDCVGLVICVGWNVGAFQKGFNVTGYSRVPDGISLIAQCDDHMDRIVMAEMQSGDVLVLKFEDDPQHMGIVADYALADELTLIHAYGRVNGKGRVEERRLEKTRVMTPMQAYRLRGVV